MQMHPAIAALRGDDAPQRQAQAALFRALAEWRRATGRLDADLAAFAAGQDIAQCQVLRAAFSDLVAASDLARDFTARTLRALAGAPLGHVPLRHFTDGTASTLLLARSGRAALFLSAVDGHGLARQAPARTVAFTASESCEMVLAGKATAELISSRRVLRELVPGDTIRRDCSVEAMILRAVQGTLVSLRLQRRKLDPAPTREVDLADGATIHLAAATAEQSRRELMMAVLGRMGRTDAAPLLAEIAREAGPDALRWQALREGLGLDSASGFAALSAIATVAADPLAAPAAALRAQLIETHPMLAACPA
jgi:hypothetical protein